MERILMKVFKFSYFLGKFLSYFREKFLFWGLKQEIDTFWKILRRKYNLKFQDLQKHRKEV